ncbi:hypothetical protein [Limnohabitans sp.]|jgi:hypothetical protein
MKLKELKRNEKTEIQAQKAKKPPGGQGGFFLENVFASVNVMKSL